MADRRRQLVGIAVAPGAWGWRGAEWPPRDSRRIRTCSPPCLANRQQELGEQQERLRQVEQELKERNEEPQASGVARMLNQAIASRTADLQRLQIDEAQLSQDITAEQGRWNEINQRLDELDRALTRK